ncbi:MAG: GTPase ObgE [Holosporales bacterium]|jgi:GTP-binding protein|nr:GTPase ObgE [Holosporales bacterium]
MKFLDEAKIYIKAGDGGNGCLSFRHAKFVEFGGPDGGAGGHGGSVYAVAVADNNTLIDYRYKQHFKAKRGENGSGQNKTGGKSDDVILQVPVGTQILDEDKSTEIADLTEVGQKVLLAKGGRGGLGNTAFKSSTNRAPRETTNGESGQERWIWLKLKLIADVGLVGLPNAGKSSLISVVTNSKSKIGDYPFSTITPQLGIIKLDYTEIVVADIPGLIEFAHTGRGLGDKFLAHIERCQVILHIIAADVESPVDSYASIRRELDLYGHDLNKKPEIIALNKSDITERDVILKIQEELEKITDNPIFIISTVTKAGIRDLIDHAAKLIAKPDSW